MKSRHVFAALAATLLLARPDAASPAQFEPIEHVGQACLIAVMRPFVRETEGRRATPEDALHIMAHCRCRDVRKVVEEAPPGLAFELWDAVREMACSR